MQQDRVDMAVGLPGVAGAQRHQLLLWLHFMQGGAIAAASYCSAPFSSNRLAACNLQLFALLHWYAGTPNGEGGDHARHTPLPLFAAQGGEQAQSPPLAACKHQSGPCATQLSYSAQPHRSMCIDVYCCIQSYTAAAKGHLLSRRFA